jgi:hypothetical protein
LRKHVLAVLIAVPAAATAATPAGSQGPAGTLSLLLRAGSPHGIGEPLTVEASFIGERRSVPVTVEADAFPYDGGWEHVGSGTTDPDTSRVAFTHRPRISTRYRVIQGEDGRQAEAEVGVGLDKERYWTCPGRTQRPKRGLARCFLVVEIRGPVAGRKVGFSTSRQWRPVTRFAGTVRLKRVRRNYYRARWRVKLNYYDLMGTCLLGTRHDGFVDADDLFADPAHRDDGRDCEFDIGYPDP